MSKAHLNLSVDSEIAEEGKKRNLNLSTLMEDAIKERLGKIEIEINQQVKNCEFCGREMGKATKDDLNGLTWLWPDEKWICPNCLLKQPRPV